MLFRRLVLVSLLVGLVSGLVLTLGQQWKVAPIIFAAEAFEGTDAVPVTAAPGGAEQAAVHQHGADHLHDGEAWAPEDGLERLFYSGLSNVLVGIGFSVMLMAIMSQLQLSGITRLTPLRGVGWGLAGFVAFFAAPGLGLPPEIPGIEAAPLGYRQGWWLLTVVLTGVGLGTLAFASKSVKVLGLVLLGLPHVIGAPQVAGPEFTHADPAVVQTLIALHGDFIVASAAANALFWSVLGLLSAWVLNRWVLQGIASQRR